MKKIILLTLASLLTLKVFFFVKDYNGPVNMPTIIIWLYCFIFSLGFSFVFPIALVAVIWIKIRSKKYENIAILRKRYERWQLATAYVRLSYITLFAVFFFLFIREIKREVVIPENFMYLFLAAGAISYAEIAFRWLEQRGTNKIAKEERKLIKALHLQ